MKLRAGDLTMEYDQGFLRYIKLGNYEVLRMIYFALRDHNWDTMPGNISNEELQVHDRSFQITYQWSSTAAEFPFVWQVEIQGTEDEQITFSIEGKALADVRKNRTGFCILHSVPENAGGPCTIISPGGEIYEGTFPKYISPHQPFFDIRKMQWPLGEWGAATLEFDGDLFETEDQRNWTDDSYKTYCTPLRLPFPMLLRQGEIIRQKVALSIAKEQPITVKVNENCVLTIGSPLPKVPAIGIGATEDKSQAAPEDLRKIARLDFDWYHFEIDFSKTNWLETWQRRLNEALLLGLNQNIILFFTDNFLEEANQFKRALSNLPPEISVNMLLLSVRHKTSPAWLLEGVEAVFRDRRKNIKIGAGTNAYFTELNRERVKVEGIDFVSYSVNPQVHAFDNASMIENLQAQEYTVESAQHYFPGCAVQVAPITLKPRFNPNATSADEIESDDLPADVDSRQWSLFGAGWTLGSIISLAKAGSDLVVYYETTGKKGLLQSQHSSPSSDPLSVNSQQFFPVYHLFRVLLAHKGHPWLPLESSEPLMIKGIGFKTDSGLKVLMANLVNQAKPVHIAQRFKKYRVIFLEEATEAEARNAPDYFAGKINTIPFSEELNFPLILPPNAIAYAELIS